jgi:hypothetical protein
MPRHRAREFRKFLAEVEQNIPANLDIHIVMENASSHKTKLIRGLVCRAPVLASSFHVDIFVLDQSGRAVFRAPVKTGDQAWGTSIDYRAGEDHALLQAVDDRGADVRNSEEPFSPRVRSSTSSTRLSAGNVSCSFLALVLKDPIADLGKLGSWPEILADLDSLTETEVEQDNKRFILRSAPPPTASLALRAVGVAVPPTVCQVAEV